MDYGSGIIVIVFAILFVWGGIWSERATRRENEKRYENYQELYESGKIYENLDNLWRCLKWLALHDKKMLFDKIWNGMSSQQKFLIILRQKKEAQRKKQEDSENNWQTSAYPADDGEGGE